MSDTTHAPDPVRSAVAQLSVACRNGRGGKAGDPVAVAEARRNLAAVKIERAIAKALEAAPPLTDDQRSRLARLLSGGVAR